MSSSASTPVATPSGTRAILLPVAGAPVEIWIPLGDDASLDAMAAPPAAAYTAYLIEGGRPTIVGPTFSELGSARAWCAHQNDSLKQQGTHECPTGQRTRWRAFERGLNPPAARADQLFPAAGPYAHAAHEEQAETAEEKE